MKNHKSKVLKIIRWPSTEPTRQVPGIRIAGLWLKEFGFNAGDYVRLNCEHGRIIITLETKADLKTDTTGTATDTTVARGELKTEDYRNICSTTDKAKK